MTAKRTQPERCSHIDLQKARAKIATGSLTGMIEFNHVKQGSSTGIAGVEPSACGVAETP
jgi:hypothetical protein